MITLYPYQERGEHDIRQAFGCGAKRVVYVAPTGSGKTVLFTDMAAKATARDRRTLILVHRRELLSQTSAALDKFGVEHGVIFRGMSFTRAPVQVASVQTLVRRLDRIPWRPDWIVVDEAHHCVPGSTWGKILDYYQPQHVLGVTATPQRLDGRGLDSTFEALVQGPQPKELIQSGYLSPPVVYAPPQGPDLDKVHTRSGDYAVNEIEEVMDRPSITGDAVDHYRRLCPGEPAIVFGATVKHAEHIAAQFQAAGFRSETLVGGKDDHERAGKIRDLADGRIHVLATCEIVSEGFDVPVVSAAILLRPTQSLALALQQMGRALRPAPGKTRALILDHAGNVWRHGLPDDDREWSLEGREKRGKKAGEEDIKVRQCPKCGCVDPAPIAACSQCGYCYPKAEREIEYVEGQLTRVDPEEIRRQRKREDWQAKTFGELVELGKRRKYKNPWAWAVIKIKARTHGRKSA